MERTTDERHEMKRSESLLGKSFNYVRQRATCYLEVWLLSECNYVAFEIGSEPGLTLSLFDVAHSICSRVISLNMPILKDAFLLFKALLCIFHDLN